MTALQSLTLLPVNVDGTNYVANPEYTSGAVGNDYENSLAPFVNLLNLTGNTPQDFINAITSGNLAQQFQNALYGGVINVNGTPTQVTGLLNLLKNGIVDPSTGQKNYMTVEMANALDQLLRTLNAAGITLNGSQITATQVEQFRNLAVSSGVVANMVQTAINTSTVDNRSLQALTELVYVQTGNDILSTQLASLQQALSATSNSLSILNSLQNLHNNLTVTPRSSFQTLFASTWALTGDNFINGSGGTLSFAQAMTIYTRPISPTLLTPITDQQAVQFQQLINQLRLDISALANPNVTPLSAQSNPQSLLGAMRVVYNDILTAISTTPSVLKVMSTDGVHVISITQLTADEQFKIAMSRWTLDSYSTVPSGGSLGSQGQIQNDLTTAITAGQSLNDTQKENVRNYLYIFEEYYKSASTILNQITQIITKMAEGISR